MSTTCNNCGEPTAEEDLLKGGICEDCYDAMKAKHTDETKPERPKCDGCGKAATRAIIEAAYPISADGQIGEVEMTTATYLCNEC